MNIYGIELKVQNIGFAWFLLLIVLITCDFCNLKNWYLHGYLSSCKTNNCRFKLFVSFNTSFQKIKEETMLFRSTFDYIYRNNIYLIKCQLQSLILHLRNCVFTYITFSLSTRKTDTNLNFRLRNLYINVFILILALLK